MDADRIVEQYRAKQDMNAATNVAAFLAAIRACEGTSGPDGYRTLFGGSLFDSFADHPRKLIPFNQTDGTREFSSAAGAYQFLARTWDDLKSRLHLTDFSPGNQDAAAVQLLADCGALAAVKEGRIQYAIDHASSIWASLPSSKYKQPKRTLSFACDAYTEAGGQICWPTEAQVFGAFL